MTSLQTLSSDEQSIATTTLVLALTIAVGLVIDGSRVGRTQFGVAGVLAPSWFLLVTG